MIEKGYHKLKIEKDEKVVIYVTNVSHTDRSVTVNYLEPVEFIGRVIPISSFVGRYVVMSKNEVIKWKLKKMNYNS